HQRGHLFAFRRLGKRSRSNGEISMARTASKILVDDEPNTMAQALREIASRRHSKAQPRPVPRRYTACLTEGGPVMDIDGAAGFDDAAMIFAASAAAPLGPSHLRVCVTDCETGTSQHFHLDL